MRWEVLAAAMLLCGSAAAQPIQLYGNVGAAPVFLDLSRNGDTVSGWYFYLKVAKQIRLEGRLDHNGFFQLEEYTASSNTRTGSFKGRAKDGHWSGTWYNAKGASPHSISFDVLRSTLRDVDGHFQCTTKHSDPQFDYTYTHSLNLALADGRVKGISMARKERSEGGDAQSCQIGMSDLKQQPSPVGILLRAKADRARSGQHCTIRLYRAGDYLVIRTGNPSQAGDDCRGAGDEMFCSPRSFWADLVVNRNTQVCRSVE
jgi:hypothetical protein